MGVRGVKSRHQQRPRAGTYLDLDVDLDLENPDHDHDHDQDHDQAATATATRDSSVISEVTAVGLRVEAVRSGEDASTRRVEADTSHDA
jgi:hypothetical protein